MKSHLFCAAVLIGLPISSSADDLRLLGRVEIPATQLDLSGERGTLEGGIPASQWGGFGSGIAYLGRGNRYAVISDRGPADGATAYRCRYHVVDIAVSSMGPQPVTVRLCETHLLSDPSGRPQIGSLSALPQSADVRGVRLDPESIRATPRGTLLISDEYGPSIGEYAPSGRQIGWVPIPTRFQVKQPSADPAMELPPTNTSGRQPNRGWECLAISPDGTTVYALLQSPLIQDGALDEMNKRIGINVRLVEIKVATGATKEYLYQLDDPSHGMNEIEFLAPGRLLVIERDSKPGSDAAFKKILEISLAAATDIRKIDALPAKGLPEGVKPVTKRVFLDLLDPVWNLAGPSFPEKIEGIAFGPRNEDGSRILIVTSDNDFLPVPSQVYAFSCRFQ